MNDPNNKVIIVGGVTLAVCVVGFSSAAGRFAFATDELIGPEQFKIEVPTDMQTEHLQIRYFLSGPFGGYGSYVEGKQGVREYYITTTIKGKDATRIRAIVYSPGNQIVRLDRQLTVTDPERTAKISFQALPDIRVAGQIIFPIAATMRQFTLQVRFLSRSAFQFFGIMDGFVPTLNITNVVVSDDGRFSVDLPDFTQDCFTQSHHSEDGFWFLAREKATGDFVYDLEPSHVGISSDFPTSIVLHATEPRTK